MDFNDTPEEAAYRAKARAWLEANAKPRTAKSPKFDQIDVQDLLKRSKDWQAKKAEAGFACITWPKAWGGQGGSQIEHVIYSQEEANFEVFSQIFSIGLGMCMPTVMVWGKEEHKQRFVGPAIRGDEVWCQLFSEPSGGSDLAGARTKAEKDGDEWVINGQKVWTTGAQLADYGILLLRTDPTVPKHKGLTMFWIDMKAPGVEVRPIKQMSGGSSFNEVFFTDLRVKDDQRLGEPGEGWQVAMTTLMNERFAVNAGFGDATVTDLIGLARDSEVGGMAALDHGAIRAKIADWYIQEQGLRFTHYRMLTALSQGGTPGPESSITKILAAKKMQDLGSFAMDLQGEGGLIRDAKLSAGGAGYQDQWFEGAGMRIGGGTDEILRNIVSERILGMPGDIRVDKGVSFNDMPRGK